MSPSVVGRRSSWSLLTVYSKRTGMTQTEKSRRRRRRRRHRRIELECRTSTWQDSTNDKESRRRQLYNQHSILVVPDNPRRASAFSSWKIWPVSIPVSHFLSLPLSLPLLDIYLVRYPPDWWYSTSDWWSLTRSSTNITWLVYSIPVSKLEYRESVAQLSFNQPLTTSSIIRQSTNTDDLLSIFQWQRQKRERDSCRRKIQSTEFQMSHLEIVSVLMYYNWNDTMQVNVTILSPRLCTVGSEFLLFFYCACLCVGWWCYRSNIHRQPHG